MLPVLIAGDSLHFSPKFADSYGPADGWTLRYRLVPRDAAGTPIVLTAGAHLGRHRVSLGASETVSWEAGSYSWAAWVEKGDQRITVAAGQCTINADPATSDEGTDTRSHARKTLDAIEAVIEKRASRDQERYTIAGRELWRTPIPQLLALRDRYAAMVAREDAAAAMAAGGLPRNKLHVRF